MKLLQCWTSLSIGEGTRVRFSHFLFLIPYFLFSCSISKQISKQADTILLKDSVIRFGHIGISIYEPATGKYWYNFQAEKYFVPASNTKLFSLYAGMKYLGDSITAFRYAEDQNSIVIEPAGDPTFLHPDYKDQRAFTFLKEKKKPVVILNNKWRANAMGFGWTWDGYTSTDGIERSPFPIYSNLIKWVQVKDKPAESKLEGNLVFSEPDVTWKVNFSEDTNRNNFSVHRKREDNIYEITFGRERRREITIPFVTNGVETAAELLRDTLNVPVSVATTTSRNLKVFHSRPVDLLFMPMMHNSDNFFAEQTLLMASNAKLGYMSDRRMIDTLLRSDLKDIPQMPRWVDGCGLSRYNLFTPKDFIYILQKLKDEFGLERLKLILPTGGTGTLSSLYIQDSGYIFAKTGTLSNHIALSGFLITKKNKLLIFSILPGNFTAAATPVRKAIEKFLSYIRQRY
ncbi:MAG TPA: D-alanyl-D-alanine carboxypeptidase [Chitinophagaceae bacterium]|nr:D-alanyl-D-alanine carboxypeptidase [Chitinophagaceae bacterium]